MKEGIHPNYREVLFQDMSNGFKFVTRSCANTKEMGTTEDGRELPLFKLDTTSESHPYHPGPKGSPVYRAAFFTFSFPRTHVPGFCPVSSGQPCIPSSLSA